MRVRSALAFAVTGAIVLSSGGATASGVNPARHRLPWPVYVGTSKGRFLIREPGRVQRLSDRRWQFRELRLPRGWIQANGPDLAHVEGGHVVVTRGRQTTWRSSNRIALASHHRLWDFQVFGQGLVYQAHRRGPLFASIAGFPERRVGRGFHAEGITRRGILITLRPRTRTLATWTRARGRGRTLAANLPIPALNNSDFDRRTGTFLYWTRAGELIRSDGIHRRVLTDFHALGFRAQPEMYVLRSGLIELFSRSWRGVVLRGDGTVFARASAPADGSVAGFGEQVASGDGRAVAYALSPASPRERSTVYLLRRGSTQGTPIYSGPGAEPCADSVSWHGDWLLFAPYDDHAVVLDPTGRRAPIRLGATIRRLPGTPRMVRWAYRAAGSGPAPA